MYVCEIYNYEKILAMLRSLTPIYYPNLSSLASFESPLWSKFPCENV